MDGIFYYTGKGLNWDMYGHNPVPMPPDANACSLHSRCQRLQHGRHRRPAGINYYEWCQDHNKPLQAAPFGDVAAGGPVTLPDPNIFTTAHGTAAVPTSGRMRHGSSRAGPHGPTPPSGTIANSAEHGGRLRVHVALA